jgi:hypothetical protein
MPEDGSYHTATGAVYVYGGNPLGRETTPVHEAGHKSTKGDSGMKGPGDYSEVIARAEESIKKNNLAEKYYEEIKTGYKGIDKERTERWIAYMTDPTEIDARQNSTRFWLYRHFPGYAAGTVFTEEHYDFLEHNRNKLPYDIQQLMELFPEKDVFISNMNTF